MSIPDTDTQLQVDHDRLTTANTALQCRAAEHEQLLIDLRDDLAASRRAHAEDIARLAAGCDTTTRISTITER